MPRKKNLDAGGGTATLERPEAQAAQRVPKWPAPAVNAAPAAPAIVTDAAGLVIGADPLAKDAQGISSAVKGPQAGPPSRRAPDSLASVSERINSSVWANGRQFDWARDPATRHHFTFTRYYFRERVLVDVWPNSNTSTRTESRKRQESIAAENVRRADRGEPPIGYLSLVRGVVLAEEAFTRALAGEVLPLLERQVSGVLV